MRRALPIVLMMILAAAPSLAGNITTFEDGTNEAVADLEAPAFSDTVNLTLPAECHIRKATMNLSSLFPGNGSSDFPEPLRVILNDTLLWEFNGTGYGALGMQYSFFNGLTEWRTGFGQAGGSNETKVRLPKNAVVRNATIAMDCSGPRTVRLDTNFTGANVYNFFGFSVSGAGDVNGDGYDDVIVGAPYNWQDGMDAGRAYIYFGGPGMDSTADVSLAGATAGDRLGWSVSGAGDVNKDGYDDVVVGAPENNTGGVYAGRAYIYLGGSVMDNTADVKFVGTVPYQYLGASVSDAGDVNNDGYADVILGSQGGDSFGAAIYFGGASMDNVPDVSFNRTTLGGGFGWSVSGAGDVDNDGCDDVIVGAPLDDTAGDNAGRAYVYLGGASMDSTADVILTGAAKADEFGHSVSGAGDLNNDGYDDVLVGAWKNDAGAVDAGRAYIYFGGAKMDSSDDAVLSGSGDYDIFGGSVSDAGDFNNDGYDDVIVGAENGDSGGPDTGQAYIYYGGANMDSVADIIFKGGARNDLFGSSVSGAKDVDNDGYDDVIVGAQFNASGGEYAGSAYLARSFNGIREAGVSAGPISVMRHPSYFNGTNISRDFGPELDQILRNSTSSGSDRYGNSYVDVPFKVSAASGGNVTFDNLRIVYSVDAAVPDFKDELDRYVTAHSNEKGADGNISIPIKVVSVTPGKLALKDLFVTIDVAPRLVKTIPDVKLPEDSSEPALVDLHEYFEDDYDDTDQIQFSIFSSTNRGFVLVQVDGNRFVAAGTLQDDNWTGGVEVVVAAADHLGLTCRSNMFRIKVTNVNDAPLITSQPPQGQFGGREFTYQVVAVDGDGDALTYALTIKPETMAIDEKTGLIRWSPPKRGIYDVVVTASDGRLSTSQAFKLSVANRSPRVTNTTVPMARAGAPYSFDLPVEDDDGDRLTFSLLSNIGGMEIGASSGRLTWTPMVPGGFEVSVRIDDGMDPLIHDFIIQVAQGNRAPVFSSSPGIYAIAGLPYGYDANATDADFDGYTFSPVAMPAGMTIDNATGKLAWTPDSAGNFTVKIAVQDGKGGEAFQEFTIVVRDRVKAKVEFTAPVEGQKAKGRLAVAGRVTKGTLDVVGVLFRVDSGEWLDTTGNSTWTYTLDTAKLKNGKHTLQARAYDGMDYSDIVSRTVTVDNAKAGGKGFIPGFGALPIILAAAALLLLRRK